MKKKANPLKVAGKTQEILDYTPNHVRVELKRDEAQTLVDGVQQYHDSLGKTFENLKNVTKEKNKKEAYIGKLNKAISNNYLPTINSQKTEIQSKDSLLLQKEQDFKILNDTFTTTLSTKEEEVITKSQLLSQATSKVKKVSRKLAQEIQSKNQLALEKEIEEKLKIEKDQEIERLREELARKEVEAQEKDALLLAKELEKQESLALKESEIREKDELLLVKESEVHNKSAEKNRIIEELASNLLTKEEVIVSKDLKIGEVSHSVKKANRKLAAKDKLLNDKEQRLEELKLLIEQNRIEKEELLAQVVNKSHMKNQIIDKLEEEINLQEDEVGNLRVQNLEKELMTQEKEKLLAEQDIRLQNLLDFNAKLDAKMQYSAKEIKIREAEKEILSKMIAQKHETLKVLLVQKESEVNEKSFEKNQVIKQLREEIIDLNKQLLEHDQHITHSVFLDEVGCQPGSSLFEKQLLESLNLSSINLSPINHGEQNQIIANILGNFDIDNQHITHSVLLSGSVEVSIIEDEFI